MRLFATSLLLAVAVADAQVVASVYVAAPQVRITSGDGMQLTATARDASGNTISNASFQWSSSANGVIRVDSGGNVAAASLGLADVTASSGGRQGVIRLQVLPQRISVLPADATVNFGSQQQYAAVAYNLQGQPIADAVFAWHVLVGGGIFDSATVTITRDGLMTANTLGYYVLRASIVYPQNVDQIQREFDGSTTLTIVPADYQVTALASSSVSYPSFHLLGKRGSISVNDTGTVALSASLDGLTAGLLAWQNQSLSLLAGAGSPALVPGTVFYDFDNPSIDSRGNVLAIANVIGTGSNIVLANASGIQVLVPDRMAADSVLDVSVVSTTRFSLSEGGDVVLRGNFHYPGSTDNYQGLLRYSRGALTLEASSKDPLPGLSGAVTFDDQYGVDANGVLYFSANAGTGRAIYRKLVATDPVKVLAVGDTWSGSSITQLPQIAVATAGDLVVRGILANGAQFLARYPGGNTSDPPRIMVTSTGGINQLYAANALGGVVFLGDLGAGYGLYLWTGGEAQPQRVLALYGPSPTGEPVADFYSAAVDAAGNVYASIRCVDTPWMLVRATSTPLLMATNGTAIKAQANLDLYVQPVFGDRTGPLHVLAGGIQPSIFQVDNRGLLPALLVGDRLPGGSMYTGNFIPRKSPSGDLYATTDNGTFHLSSGGQSLVVAYPYLFPDGVRFFNPYSVAVNDHNQLSMMSGTDHSHQRLALFDGGTLRTIAYFQGSSPYLTPSPSGGTFSNFSEQAINDSGEVMVIATVAGGPGGLFLYDGNGWQGVCLLQTCQLDGEAITAIQQLRVSNNKFCAVFTTRVGNTRIDCWEAGTWTNVMRRGDTTSDGTGINSFGVYDINRQGDVAVVLFTGLNGPSVFVKTADRFATAQAAIFPTPDGSFLQGIYSVDLRDDRRVFFLAQDYSGRVIAYEADPQF